MTDNWVSKETALYLEMVQIHGMVLNADAEEWQNKIYPALKALVKKAQELEGRKTCLRCKKFRKIVGVRGDGSYLCDPCSGGKR